MKLISGTQFFQGCVSPIWGSWYLVGWDRQIAHILSIEFSLVPLVCSKAFSCRLCDPSTVLHPATYSRVSPASPTWLWDDGCGLLHLTGLLYQPSVSLQSAGGRFRSLAPTVGTICHSHSMSSDNVSGHSCSLVHIRTFLLDLHSLWTLQ